MLPILLLSASLGIADHDADAQAALALAKAKRERVAKVEPVKVTPKSVRIADPLSHIHRCPSCGTEWSHANSSAGDTAKHTCPTCHKVLPAPWWPSERGVRLQSVRVTYRDVLDAVQAGERVTVAVGVEDSADCSVDQIPDTEPGVWRCYLREGEPVMERVTAAPMTVYQNILTLPGSR